MDLLRGRSRPVPETAQGSHLGPTRTDARGQGRLRRVRARVPGRNRRTETGREPEADLSHDHPPRAKGEKKGFAERDYARLLDDAHQQLNAPIVLVWDNLNTHKSALMRRLIAARDWLTVFYLPSYAPEYNPVEGVWAHMKTSLANLAKRTLNQLVALVNSRLRGIQSRPALLNGLIAKTGLDLQPAITPALQPL